MQVRQFLQKYKTRALSLVLAVSLLGCEGVVSNPPPPLEWIVALDITTTVSEPNFYTMRDRMVPELVLSRLRSRDVIHLLQIDSDPGDTITRIPVSARQIGFDQEITEIFTKYIRAIQRPSSYRGMTNIGGVLAYAERITRELRTQSSQAKRVVVLILTDGKPEGKQTRYTGEWPEGVHVSFWGVEPQHETSLMKWATQTMHLSQEQLKLVQMNSWETAAEGFGALIGRPFQDEYVVRQLQAVEELNVSD